MTAENTDMVSVFKARWEGETDIIQIKCYFYMLPANARKRWTQDYHSVLNIFPIEYTLGSERRKSTLQNSEDAGNAARK